MKYLTTPNLALETFIQCTTINGNGAVNLWGWLTGAWEGKERANETEWQSKQIARELLALLSVVILIGHRETEHDTKSNRPPSAFISPEASVQLQRLLFSLNSLNGCDDAIHIKQELRGLTTVILNPAHVIFLQKQHWPSARQSGRAKTTSVQNFETLLGTVFV